MTAAQTFNLTDLDDSERVAWLRAHAVPTGERDGVTTWVMSDGSRVERVATMGAACFGTLPASPALPKPGQLSAGATAATITESGAGDCVGPARPRRTDRQGPGPARDPLQAALPRLRLLDPRHVHGNPRYRVVHELHPRLRRC